MSQTKAQLIDGKSAEIEFSSGSASLPAISFTGDTNTGIYSPGADQLALSTNGTGRLFIDSSGNVGIGTSTARAGLTVALGSSTIPTAGASTAAAIFGNELDDGTYGVIIGANGSGTGYLQAQRGDGLTDVYPLAIQPNGGNVGIGTTTPGSLLELGGVSNPNITLNGSATAGHRGLIFEYNGTKFGELGQNIQTGELKIRSGELGQNGYFINFQVNGNNAARIDSSGRLLVGTSSAPANTSTAVSIVQSGPSITKFGYQDGVTDSFTSITGATVGNETSVYLVTIKLIGDGNFYSTATYILNSAAYAKTFTQIGTASNHFGNGYLLAQLSSYSGTSSSVQVRRSSAGNATCTVHMLKLM